MGAILLVLAARARRYWRSWLLLGLVLAIGTGLVLAMIGLSGVGLVMMMEVRPSGPGPQ